MVHNVILVNKHLTSKTFDRQSVDFGSVQYNT